MRLFDTHAHILDPAFDEDREELVRTFSDAGLIHIVECSCCTEDIEPIRELCRKHPALSVPLPDLTGHCAHVLLTLCFSLPQAVSDCIVND